MNKKKIFTISLSIATCMVLGLTTMNVFASSISNQKEKRLSGANRFHTATAISQEGWISSQAVVLANAYDFPDALSGVTLAYLKDAPILLTQKEEISSSTLEEMKRLNAKDVYILGGNGAVSASAEQFLKDSGYNVERFSGSNRFNTAVTIGDKVVSEKATDTVFISYAYNFPDALSASTFAARKGYPILFTDKDSLNEATKNAIKNWGIKNVYILGGTGVISQNVENSLGSMELNITRLEGANRYATAINILQEFDKGSYNGLSLASGLDFPDALAGSVLAAKENAPIMIYNAQSISPGIAKLVKTMADSHVYVLGGEGAIPEKDVIAVQGGNAIDSSPAPIENIQPAFAGINDEWRERYFGLVPNHYSGVKESIFDNITMAVANGNLSKEEAESKLSAVGTWAEPNSNETHTVFRVKITVYPTATNNVQELLKEINYGIRFTGGNYSNSYICYDSTTNQNRVVMVGVDLINTTILMPK